MTGALAAIAVKELRDGLRNRWALSIALGLAVLALVIAWFGPAASGTVGFASLGATVVSLASLAVFLVPLVALLLGYEAVVGEAERGTLLLLLAYPVSRGLLLAGKFAGHALLLAAAITVGLGGAALVLAATGAAAAEGFWPAFARLVASTVLLGWAFLALAYAISAGAREKGRAAALALAAWLGLVLVYDLLLLGALVAAAGRVPAWLFEALLVANPADAFRVLNLGGEAAREALGGLGGLVHGAALSPALLVSVLLAWTALLLGLAFWRFARRPV